MNRNGILVSLIIIVLLIVGGAYIAFGPMKAHAPGGTATTTTQALHNQVSYACDGGKTIQALYTDGQVALTLSDGRTLKLPQVVSGSGIRYETGAGTGADTTFASKGDNSFLTENGSTTYDNCVAGGTATTAAGMKSFTDQGKTFTFTYPSSFTVSGGGVGYTQDWMAQATTSGLVLAKVTVPQSYEPKTNFSGATFTVGTSADTAAVASCLTYNPSGSPEQAPTSATVNGVKYTVFHSGDAGAGNFYDTTSYRTVRGGQCYAVEYTIHTTNLGNYSPDQGISAFDQAKIQNALQGIVQSFKFTS